MKQAQLRSHPGNQAFCCSGPVTMSSTWRCRPRVRSLVDWPGPRTLTTGRLQEWTTNRARIVARTRDTTMTRWIRSLHSKYDTNRHQYMDPGRLKTRSRTDVWPHPHHDFVHTCWDSNRPQVTPGVYHHKRAALYSPRRWVVDVTSQPEPTALANYHAA